MAVAIPLTRGLSTWVDDEDAEWLGRWKWYALNSTGGFYAARTETDPVSEGGGKRCILMHRAITGCAKGLVVDHADRNRLNNRRINLRIGTQVENQRNRRMRRTNTTGFKGVTRNHKRWMALITIDRKYRYLGTYDTPEEAHAAYCAAATEHFGEFARFA